MIANREYLFRRAIMICSAPIAKQSDMIFAALLLLSAHHAPPSSPSDCVPRHLQIFLRLAGFDSSAEIELPASRTRPAGVAILLAGSDVADRNGAIVDASGNVVSRPLRQVADRLACVGYASIRYNKRYVKDATTVDRERFDRLNGADLASDGRAALALARADPGRAGLPITLVGWSQGTTVAMAVAAAEPDDRAVSFWRR